ncbi:hypothetical protein KCG54_00030 [Neisseria subflava]|uniref:ABC transporter ATP-binding protein n=1 Tax=Neisseria subflava TaxID=28449 RepID=A0A9X9N197_NEISU|nr:hypothetical protein [Neisseria subflava]UTG69813.1 hypothetical protein KCG54_00030 [Neisseria subflava]
MIAIAHRLSTIAAMDRLIVLDKAASSKKAATPSCSRTRPVAKLWAHKAAAS